MDRLELNVDKPGLDKCRNLGRFGVDEFLQVRHEIRDLVRRRRNEQGVAWTRSTDPVLRTAEFSGLLAAAAALRKQCSVYFADEPKRQRELLPKPGETMVHCRDVVGDF